MKTKLIALGNVLMGDDGIAINVANSLINKLKEREIEVIIGETDFDYCLDNINMNDSILILDAVNFGKKPGELTLKTMYSLIQGNYDIFSQHNLSIIKFLEILDKSVEIFFIGIEVNDVNFRLGISDVLKEKYNSICEHTLEIIDQLIGLNIKII